MYNNYTTEKVQLQEVLEDYKLVNGRRKRIKWEIHKDSATKLADSYGRLGLHSKANRVDGCGNYLTFAMTDDGLHLQHAKFCKVRLCPMCAWRRSLKIFAQTSKIMDCYDRLKPTYKYIFLTLTCRNVSGDLLANQIDQLSNAWRNMVRRADIFRRQVNGWFRALEITHNLQADTYHPHYHCILAVPNSYFKGQCYMSQIRWVQLWRDCMGVDYDPIVDVRLLRGKSGVAEVSKYAAKPTDYLITDDDYNINTIQTDRAVAVLDSALHKRRLIAYGGEFKRLHKALDLDDIDKGDLIHIDDSVRADVGQALYVYHWHVGYRRYTLTDVIQSDGGDDDV